MTLKIQGAEVEGAGKSAVNTAHAEGTGTMATAIQSHAEGMQSFATVQAGHAEGFQTVASSGLAAHAEGNQSQATASAAHAEGFGCFASANYSHAEGNGTTTNGSVSHAQGYVCTTNGYASHASGQGSVANIAGQFAHSSGVPANGAARSQTGILTLSAAATTGVVLTVDGGVTLLNTGQNANILLVGTYTNIAFRCDITARRSGAVTSSQSWTYQGLIARDSGNVRMVGTPSLVTSFQDVSIATITFTANTTLNSLSVIGNPTNGVMTNFLATLYYTELTLTS